MCSLHVHLQINQAAVPKLKMLILLTNDIQILHISSENLMVDQNYSSQPMIYLILIT